MKIIVNKCYGSCRLSDWVVKEFNLESSWQYDREDPKLIELIEKLGDKVNSDYSNLKVIDIPDESTDWVITNYDGMETLFYVIDGKIKEI